MTGIEQTIREQIARNESVIIRNLAYIGETAVNAARSLPSPNVVGLAKKEIRPHQPNYIDWTANLRSSIGYVVVANGQVVGSSPFDTVKDGAEGSSEGKNFANELASKYSQGYVLLIVAGMRYAAYVKKRGYDVIDSAELLARQLVKQLFA